MYLVRKGKGYEGKKREEKKKIPKRACKFSELKVNE